MDTGLSTYFSSLGSFRQTRQLQAPDGAGRTRHLIGCQPFGLLSGESSYAQHSWRFAAGGYGSAPYSAVAEHQVCLAARASSYMFAL